VQRSHLGVRRLYHFPHSPNRFWSNVGQMEQGTRQDSTLLPTCRTDSPLFWLPGEAKNPELLQILAGQQRAQEASVFQSQTQRQRCPLWGLWDGLINHQSSCFQILLQYNHKG
jgi:hypothetical protein